MGEPRRLKACGTAGRNTCATLAFNRIPPGPFLEISFDQILLILTPTNSIYSINPRSRVVLLVRRSPNKQMR
jgi:hypothetical protein